MVFERAFMYLAVFKEIRVSTMPGYDILAEITLYGLISGINRSRYCGTIAELYCGTKSKVPQSHITRNTTNTYTIATTNIFFVVLYFCLVLQQYTTFA